MIVSGVSAFTSTRTTMNLPRHPGPGRSSRTCPLRPRFTPWRRGYINRGRAARDAKVPILDKSIRSVIDEPRCRLAWPRQPTCASLLCRFDAHARRVSRCTFTRCGDLARMNLMNDSASYLPFTLFASFLLLLLFRLPPRVRSFRFSNCLVSPFRSFTFSQRNASEFASHVSRCISLALPISLAKLQAI